MPSSRYTGTRLLSNRALGDRSRGALLRHERELVERLARDALERGDRVSSDALVGLRVTRPEALVAGVHQRTTHALLRRAERRVQRHHLAAAGDDDVLQPRHDRGRGEVRRRDARAAEAIERDAGGLRVEPSVEQRHPGEVAALGADLHARAEDDVVDDAGVDVVAVPDRGQHRRAELLRMDVGESALAHLADATRGTASIDDPRFWHQKLLRFVRYFDSGEWLRNPDDSGSRAAFDSRMNLASLQGSSARTLAERAVLRRGELYEPRLSVDQRFLTGVAATTT